MSWLSNSRALALAAVLAAAPVLPSVPEAPAAFVPAASADEAYARAEARPALASSAFDAAKLNTMMGDAARLSWTGEGPDAASGAYKLGGVTFELLGDEPHVVFTADEILLWNADLDALSARLDGQRLGDTIRLFDRIEFGGLKLDLTDYTNSMEQVIADALPDSEAAALEYGESSMDVGRVILSGMTLHPWTYAEVEGEAEDIAGLRIVSALLRSFSLESTLFLDATMDQTFAEAGASGSLLSTYEGQLLEGYDRGNIASWITTGVTYAGEIPIPADPENPASVATSLPMTGSSAYSAVTGMKFANLLEYGERGEMPAITARDLMSIGTYTLEDTQVNFGGKPFFDIGRAEFKADKFSWFLPERITMSHEDASFHIADFLELIAVIEPGAPSADGEPGLLEITGMLNRSGFGTLSGDGDFEFAWNAETGASHLESNSVADRLYTDNTRLDLTLPSYAQVIPAFGLDGKTLDEEALSAVLDETLRLSGGHYRLTDTGGLDAVSTLVIEIAKFSGDTDSMMSGFAESTPEAVRMFASGMLMFGAGAVSAEIPQATQWISSLSQFMTGGGTIELAFAPDQPVGHAELTGLGPDSGMVESPDMAALVDLFNVTVTHTPAASPASEP